jgi:hypothetical protein
LGPALAGVGWQVEGSGAFGLRPRWPALVALGMWVLAHRPAEAMRWYNRVLPRSVRRQAPLVLEPGLAVPRGRVDEVVVLARRRPPADAAEQRVSSVEISPD